MIVMDKFELFDKDTADKWSKAGSAASNAAKEFAAFIEAVSETKGKLPHWQHEMIDKIVNRELESYYGEHTSHYDLQHRILPQAASQIESAFPTKVYLSSLYGSIPHSNGPRFFTESFLTKLIPLALEI